MACLGGDRVALESRPLPGPGAGELLLRLRVVGFCGTDLVKLESGTIVPGSVLGHELVGEVVELGAGVESFQAGDRVAVPHHVACGVCALCRRGSETSCATFREDLLDPGGFADHVRVRARAVARAARRVPDDVADEAAVFLEPAACVLRGVNRSGIPERGAVAVVLGGGSMGLLHLLVLRAARADVRVVVVDPLAERLELAERLGAAATGAPRADLRRLVDELSGGLGADAVFDTVGGSALLRDGLALTRQGGTVVLFAHAPEPARADFDLNALFKHERRVLGSYSGGLAEQQQVFELIASGRLDASPIVSHRLPLDEFERGIALARARQALKILFTPSRAEAA